MMIQVLPAGQRADATGCPKAGRAHNSGEMTTTEGAVNLSGAAQSGEVAAA